MFTLHLKPLPQHLLSAPLYALTHILRHSPRTRLVRILERAGTLLRLLVKTESLDSHSLLLLHPSLKLCHVLRTCHLSLPFLGLLSLPIFYPAFSPLQDLLAQLLALPLILACSTFLLLQLLGLSLVLIRLCFALQLFSSLSPAFQNFLPSALSLLVLLIPLDMGINYCPWHVRRQSLLQDSVEAWTHLHLEHAQDAHENIMTNHGPSASKTPSFLNLGIHCLHFSPELGKERILRVSTAGRSFGCLWRRRPICLGLFSRRGC
mmetsp:Transcript_10507/g.23916  ORF Transcript_10507/g.23916 Transcript_10507/m.23916 type:complete len:263 (+) Transcript_10507:401-1189(+)